MTDTVVTFFLLLICLICASCSKGIEIFGSPRTQQDAGLIVSCTTKAQAQEVAQKYHGHFRVLSESNKLMEIVGVDEESIRVELPKAKLKKNHIYSFIDEDLKAQSIEESAVQSTSRSQFSHLTQIGATNLASGQQGENIIIAIVDSGVALDHSHLAPNIFINSKETLNASDDDNNGLIDDLNGWNFVHHNNQSHDDNGHGTHVAGLAAGILSGVAPRAKILPVKVLDRDGRGDLGTIAAGILYAINSGAKIINLSLGGPFSGVVTNEVRALLNQAQLAEREGVMLVAAAGNGGQDGAGDCNDAQPIYPASIKSVSVVAVAAVDQYNNITSYSNYGGSSVHLAAPGGGDWGGGLLSTAIPFCHHSYCSTLANYTSMSGTSMATPLVSGALAILKSLRPHWSLAQLKNHLLNTGTPSVSLEGVTISGRALSVRRMLDGL